MKTKRMPLLVRTVACEPVALDAKDRGLTEGDAGAMNVALSSEYEVERYDWWTDTRWIEILGHAPGEIDFSRFESGGIAFLADHNRSAVAGLGTAPVVRDGKLRMDVRFSRGPLGQQLRADMADGIRPYISVGYAPRKATLVETRDGGLEVWRVTQWTPIEASSVSIPADPSVGVGRSAVEGERGTEISFEVEIEEGGAAVREEVLMNGKPGGADAVTIRSDGTGAPGMAAAPVAPAPVAPAPAPVISVGQQADGGRQGQDAAFREASEIAALGAAWGMSEHVAGWLQRGLTAAEVALEITRTRKSPTQVAAQPAAEVVLPARDAERYSYRRAVAAAAGIIPLDGLEREIHQELDRAKPEKYQSRGGVLVPLSLREMGRGGEAVRTMDSLTASKGVDTVFDQPGEMIELLRNLAAVSLMGARILPGLSAPVPFVKQTGGMTVYWVSENPASDVTASDINWGTVLLAPKTMQGTTAFSRQLLVLSSLAIESMVRLELAIGHALAMDRAALHGIGAAAEPMGIYTAPDVNAVAFGGAPTFTKFTDMVGAVGDKNAFVGNLGWMTTPLMAATLMHTLVASAAGSAMIWNGPLDQGSILGYRAIATNQVSKVMSGSAPTGGSEHGIVFGNWADAVLGFWSAMEVVVDPYAQKKKGLVEVTSFQMGDLILRHGESFAKSTGATLT